MTNLDYITFKISFESQSVDEPVNQSLIVHTLAVRFGRIQKKEKTKLVAAMHKMKQISQEKQLTEQLDEENHLLANIIQAHEETCDYTKEKVAPLIERARTQPVYAHCPPQMVSARSKRNI